MASAPGYLSPWVTEKPITYGNPVATSIGQITQRAETIELSRFAFLSTTEREEFLASVMAYLSGADDWTEIAGK
jgi:hypothetical protein